MLGQDMTEEMEGQKWEKMRSNTNQILENTPRNDGRVLQANFKTGEFSVVTSSSNLIQVDFKAKKTRTRRKSQKLEQ